MMTAGLGKQRMKAKEISHIQRTEQAPTLTREANRRSGRGTEVCSAALLAPCQGRLLHTPLQTAQDSHNTHREWRGGCLLYNFLSKKNRPWCPAAHQLKGGGKRNQDRDSIFEEVSAKCLKM